jgi:hypothetical protein
MGMKKSENGRNLVTSESQTRLGPAAVTKESELQAKKILAGDLDPAEWVKQYFDASGKIPPDKMKLAIQDALRESDPTKAMLNYAQLMRELTTENAPVAYDTFRETVSGFDAMRYGPMLSYSWGALDGEKSIAKMQETGGREAMFGIAGAIGGWASKDAEAAKKWLDGNTNIEGREFMSRAMIAGMAQQDIDQATKMVLSMPAEQRGDMTQALIDQQIRQGMDSATTWTLGLTDEGMKASAFERLSQQMTRQGSDKASQWLKQYADKPFAKEAVKDTARDLADKDPKNAMKWLDSLPAGENKDEALGPIFSQWGREDPVEASAALVKVQAGPGKNKAINQYVNSIARERPDEAVTWANSITDPQMREDSYVSIVQNWRRNDPVAANNWASSNLTPDAQRRAAEAPRRDWRPPWMGGGGRPRRPF